MKKLMPFLLMVAGLVGITSFTDTEKEVGAGCLEVTHYSIINESAESVTADIYWIPENGVGKKIIINSDLTKNFNITSLNGHSIGSIWAKDWIEIAVYTGMKKCWSKVFVRGIDF